MKKLHAPVKVTNKLIDGMIDRTLTRPTLSVGTAAGPDPTVNVA